MPIAGTPKTLVNAVEERKQGEKRSEAVERSRMEKEAKEPDTEAHNAVS